MIAGATPNNEKFNISYAAHPVICLLHGGFKLAAVFSYLFMNLITQSSIHTFIVVIIICAVEFWFVKNVSGRVLVKLRWWNGEEETGREGWYFESFLSKEGTADVDRHIFWWAQCLFTGFWAVLLFVKCLAFSIFWGMLVGICFSLSATNLYGYYLCNNEHDAKMKRLMNQLGKNYSALRESLRLAMV